MTAELRGDSLNRTLFTVGPVEVRKEVLEAMTKPMITHRGKDYEQFQANLVEKLHKTLDTDMNIMMSPSSASGLLEACVRCGVKSNMAGISNGSLETAGRASAATMVKMSRKSMWNGAKP